MKLVFIENRYKTYFYEPIVKELQKIGHEIHWLIQNKEFVPNTSSHIHYIPYPNGETKIHQKNLHIEEIIQSDRQINNFGSKSVSHFYYYYHEIEKYITRLQPDIVFGESTAFHELLTILVCKEQEILYLNPSSCRYPVGRFSFYKYNTLEPYLGSAESLTNQSAQEIIDQIIHRTSAPDYMRLVPPSSKEKLTDKLLKIKSYYTGEKFNTPNPKVKYRLEKEKKKHIANWDQIATNNLDSLKGFLVLYPLQMQPEANLDVWGRKHRNQEVLIETLANSLPSDAVLVVKPNPKSNYELTSEMVSLVKQRDNIVAVPHQMKMDDVLPKVDLVVTVTGTIAIECILSDKPIVTLVNTINNRIQSCTYVDNIDSELPDIIQQVQHGKYPMSTKEEKIAFVQMLNELSYKGKISDPFTDTSCISESNIENMVKAFRHIINVQ